eukprot:gene18705-20593_t
MSSPLVLKDGAAKNVLTIDEILPMIGGFGKFQIILEIVFCIISIPGSMAVLLPYFAQHDPGWRCAINSTICRLDGTITSSNKNDFEKRCNMPRSEWQFTQPKDYSVVTQFDLSCEMVFYNLLATSMVFISIALGALVLGWLADRYGRKPVLIPSSAAIVIIGFISAFSPNFAFYAVARVLVGFFLPGNALQLFIMVSEFVGPRHRPLAGNTLWIAFSVNIALLGVIAYFVRTWKLLVIICTAPYFFTFIFFKFIPESIRWLCLNGRTEDAMEIINRIAKVNGRAAPDVKLAEKIDNTEMSFGSLLNLFRPMKMAVSTLIQSFGWVVNGLVYYGVSFAAADLGGNMYRDYILLSLAGIPGTSLGIYLCRKIGRKKTVLIPTFIGGLACIAASLIPTDDKKFSSLIPLRVFFGFLGKFCITISYASISTWSVELYPTVIRGAAVGYLQIANRLGSALAPWVATWLIGIHVVLPFSLMGGCAIICALLLLKLPETASKPTAETFKDLQNDATVKAANVELKTSDGEDGGTPLAYIISNKHSFNEIVI